MSDYSTRGTAGYERAETSTRSPFLMRTYGHLLGAIMAFTLLELVLFRSGLAESIAGAMFGAPWLLWLGAFMVVGYLASRFALTSASLPVQYAALAGFIVAEALIFVPLLYVAEFHAQGVIANAAMVTITGFTALTAVVFLTRKDFSFLRGVLIWGAVAALGFIVIGSFAGWSGGTLFPVLMIALAGASILYDTSNVLLRYPEDRYVGAALSLFASVALMFWYVLSLFLSRD
ncbi:MAG: Bax inhibitor-1 family protein [Planctomycetota bacterium]|nr:Bax inhibitor-1 family protein [Planctomycetota bacterium]